jgi:hypothetical protein
MFLRAADADLLAVLTTHLSRITLAESRQTRPLNLDSFQLLLPILKKDLARLLKALVW